jgi:hypothetical protein
VTIHGATILQITPAPGRLADDFGNVYAGYALIELDVEYQDGERATVRDIFPFDPTGCCIGLPKGAHYLVHGIGDDRASFADFFGDGGDRITPHESTLAQQPRSAA